MTLTEAQRALARHALGLPNSHRRTYRNRFLVQPGTPAHAEWEAMVASGHAVVRRSAERSGAGDHFTLTRAGADQALERGEALCTEDFPSISSH